MYSILVDCKSTSPTSFVGMAKLNCSLLLLLQNYCWSYMSIDLDFFINYYSALSRETLDHYSGDTNSRVPDKQPTGMILTIITLQIL